MLGEREEADEVFIHTGNVYYNYAGCKGVCRESTTQYDDYQESEVFYGKNVQGTINLIRDLYDKHESNLTGDKFILKPNSTASNDAFMNQLRRHYKSVGVPISLPD